MAFHDIQLVFLGAATNFFGQSIQFRVFKSVCVSFSKRVFNTGGTKKSESFVSYDCRLFKESYFLQAARPTVIVVTFFL